MVWSATKNIISPLDVDTLISLKFLLHKEKTMRTHFTQSKEKKQCTYKSVSVFTQTFPQGLITS